MTSSVILIIVLAIIGILGNWLGVALIIDACSFYGLAVIFGLLLGLCICLLSTICIVLATCVFAESWEESHK